MNRGRILLTARKNFFLKGIIVALIIVIICFWSSQFSVIEGFPVEAERPLVEKIHTLGRKLRQWFFFRSHPTQRFITCTPLPWIPLWPSFRCFPKPYFKPLCLLISLSSHKHSLCHQNCFCSKPPCFLVSSSFSSTLFFFPFTGMALRITVLCLATFLILNYICPCWVVLPYFPPTPKLRALKGHQ